MKPRHLLAAALIAFAATTHAATLRWGAQNDILTLDPHSQNHATTSSILQHTYEGLTRYTKTYAIEPALATGWQQISPTQLRFTLRKGVKFHDGSPFTADDVVFSYGRIMQPQGTMQVYVGSVKEVKKVDDHTVDFLLSGPNPVLLRNIADFRIMSKAWSVKNKSENVQNYVAKEESYASRNANGTGPYILKTWEPDKRVVFAANPDWWDKREGNVTDIVYTPIKADATRIAALLSGDVDMVTDLPPQDVTRLRSEAKLKVLDGHEVRTIFIGMDQHSDELRYSSVKGKNPFKDLRVRKALNLAVDREAIRRVTMRGLSIPAAIMVAPGVHGHSKDIDQAHALDVDGAKRLLAEAGYGSGFEFGLDCPNNRYVNDEEICQALVGMWARIGLKAKLNAQPMATFIQKIQKFDHDAYMLGWGVVNFDANYTLQSLVRTKTTGADGSFNLGRISDARIDALVDAIKTELDTGKRDAMLREGLVATRDNYYYVPLHHQLRPWAMKKNVTAVHNAVDRHESRYTRVD
ncbi:MAG: ABC transporter substrate-binding protein [Betaproteobacteria bacterium]|nr:ABC transporter substrate-binding protein [Betaproteobacteria bacterium]MDH5211676.1 ABC transporter substrate-binding protein [Betaproteobacteria bacterium]